MKIYDSNGQEIADIAKDNDVVRLVMLSTTGTHERVHEIFYGVGDTQDPQFEARLRNAYESNGFRFESAKDIEQKTARNVYFIHESNLIENIVEIDEKLIGERYKKRTQLGCVGAWLLGEDRVKDKQPLSGKDVISMQRMLTDEQAIYGHFLENKYRGIIRGENDLVSIGGRTVIPPRPEDYESFFTRFNGGLQQLNPRSIREILCYLAKTHVEYESMHPFADGNGRTGRNIVNYGLSYFSLPVLVFTNQDKGKYYAGFIETTQDISVMEAYFIEKYREQNPGLFQ